ncbi:MAG: murein biosynthesis integral membrane protein MurJ [Gemmatimonadaceae bacterium]|jgi:putative peptidoglycan lipid II flippase|nr:murein biosynthesis integral membrane protein MurJ [Gemmatimonadaceae bacterium]
MARWCREMGAQPAVRLTMADDREAPSTERGAASSDRTGRGAMLVGAGILVSRVLGLVRNTVFAHYLGASSASDAYTAALKIPNAVRNLLGEGTLSAAFIPVYSRLLATRDEAGARVLARAVLGVLLLVVSAVTVLGIALAPVLTRVIAAGFDAPTAALTTRMVRVLFPMTGLMVISGWCLGVQNAHRRFFVAYASAALWSIAQIVLLWWGGPRAPSIEQLAVWLAWATLGGALLQVVAQLPEVVRLSGPPLPLFRASHAGVSTVLRNMGPVITALGVVQISSFVDVQVASWLPTGAATMLSYAQTLALLPVSLFGVSVAAAALPDLARDEATLAHDQLRERVRGGWQRVLFYIVPSAAAFVVLGDLMVGMLYRTGRFGAREQQIVHVILGAYALGLVSAGAVKLLASAHYALRDYRTPLKASITSVLISGVLATATGVWLRDWRFAAAGIAAGSALGSYANLVLLLGGLRARVGALYTPAMWAGTRRIVVATVVAIVAGLGVRWAVGTRGAWIAGPPALASFGLAYLLTAWRLGSGEAARWLRLPARGGG